jgi:branched-chain amino acid aminotransferase
VVEDGGLATPRTVACPEGITRATVLELCGAHGIPCAVRDVSLAEVHRADEVFCTGTMGELAGVVRVDGRTIGDGAVGPVTRRLAELYGALVRQGGERVVG